MSILIKGMELPNDCYVCSFAKWTDDGCAGCVADDKIHNASKPVDCPLIEIPKPHGRLIDGDALQCKVDDIGLGYYEVLGVTEDTIDSAPTVIEAEGR